MKLKKGDNVKVLSGKDRGKTGKIIRVFPDAERITVEGLHMVMKRVRPRKSGEKGQTVSIARPFPISNVALVCGNCGKQTRVGFRMEGEKKVRYCKKCESST